MSSLLIQSTLVIGTFGLALLIGQLLYYRYYCESRGIESAFRLILNVGLLILGGSMIIGGFYLSGAIIVVIGWYFWLSNYRRVQESDIATDTVRSTLANFHPSNGRRR